VIGHEPILLTRMLTTDTDDSGYILDLITVQTPQSSPIRQSWPTLDGRDLATDQRVREWPTEGSPATLSVHRAREEVPVTVGRTVKVKKEAGTTRPPEAIDPDKEIAATAIPPG
jgi:hypothetical protein